MSEKEPIGRVTHYFDKLGVAVIGLTGSLKIGDRIEIITAEGPFQQEVSSMQADRKPIEHASIGDSVGMKVDHPVRQGNPVSRVIETE